MDKNTQLIRIFNSRLCHDLIGPAGSLDFALNLLQEDTSVENKEAIDIASTSISNLINRLSFYRMGVGAASLGEEPDVVLKKAKDLIINLFKEKDVNITWDAKVDDVLHKVSNNDNAKLIMNIFLVIFYAIPRVAIINVFAKSLDKDTVGFAVSVNGKGVKLGSDNLDALKYTEIDHITPRTVQSYFTAILAKDLGTIVEMEERSEGEIQVAINLKK